MSIQLSTGFKSRILGRDSFIDIFQNGFIELHSGTQPVTADNAPGTSTLVGTVSGHGTGVGLWFIQSGQWLSRDPAQPWKFVAAFARTASWFRLRTATDGGAFSYTDARIDGSVGDPDSVGPFDIIIPQLSFTPGQSFLLQQFLFTFPPIPGG